MIIQIYYDIGFINNIRIIVVIIIETVAIIRTYPVLCELLKKRS